MPISTTPNQAAAMSAEAVAFLEASHPYDAPAELIAQATAPEMIPAMRERFFAVERPVEDALIARHKLNLEPGVLGGVPVLIITPPKFSPDFEGAVVINIHGGGSVFGDARERGALLTAGEFGVRVVSVEYTRAPEAKAPAPIDQSLAVYRELLKEYDPGKIIGVSNSSGSSIMLAMVRAAQEEGLPVPVALALFTPVTDLSGVGDSGVANGHRDVISTEFAVSLLHQNYLGGMDPKDPRVSPIYGSFVGFPPCIVSTGTRDLMLSNAARLQWVLRDAGVPMELLVSEGMWHGFQWEPTLPEAVAVRHAVGAFLVNALHHAQADKS